MKSIFPSEYTKDGVFTPSKHLMKRQTPMMNREISREELIRLNEITMEKKSKLKPLRKGA